MWRQEKLKTSPLAILKQQDLELTRQLAHAEEKLAAADAGSLFDLKGSKGRAEKIARAVLKRLKEAK